MPRFAVQQLCVYETRSQFFSHKPELFKRIRGDTGQKTKQELIQQAYRPLKSKLHQQNRLKTIGLEHCAFETRLVNTLKQYCNWQIVRAVEYYSKPSIIWITLICYILYTTINLYTTTVRYYGILGLYNIVGLYLKHYNSRLEHIMDSLLYYSVLQQTMVLFTVCPDCDCTIVCFITCYRV